MKKLIAIASMVLCLAGTTTAFARGYSHHGGYSGGSHSYRSGHHHDGLGIAVGVVGGLLLGSALIGAASPPPAVVYQPEVVVRPPQICYEDRIVNGEWRVSRYSGRQVWVSYPYPVTRRYQVPCY